MREGQNLVLKIILSFSNFFQIKYYSYKLLKLHIIFSKASKNIIEV